MCLYKAKMDVVKAFLGEILAREQKVQNSYVLGKAYFGCYESHCGTLSVVYKDKLKGKLNIKFGRNQLKK